MAHIGLVPVSSVGSIEAVLALIAVDSFRVVSAILANAAALVTTMDVQRLTFQVDLFRINAFVGVSMAVAS